MKQTIQATKVIALGLFALCTTSLTNSTFAGVKSNDPAAEFKFIGKINNKPVFQLNINNTENDEYIIKVKNANYENLYSEKIKGNNLSRKYSFDVDDTELNAPDFGIRVEVTSVKTHKTEVYKISSHTSVTENIVVAKL